MSTQSIKFLNVKDTLDEIDEFYICEADKLIYKEDYDLGVGADINKFALIQNIDRILIEECLDIDYHKFLEKINLTLNI
ncbi:MAG: hypothetical protein LBM02_10045 [Lachnospiraceae bacterium]|jgi:hypothetical protein|nr:hypothetical protein [Lachnospiraceae bacterium]